MKNRLRVVIVLVIISVNSYSQNIDGNLQKFRRALELIYFNYVDTVNTSKLTEQAIEGMLDKLDPHSSYISKEYLAESNEALQGNFEGVGIQFQIVEDSILVITPITGGPSEKLGILAGDRIVEIDKKNVAGIGIKNEDVRKYLRGAKGTVVNVGIKRKNVKNLIYFDIVRDKIPIYSIYANYIIRPGVGYIKLDKFSAMTMNEYSKAMNDLKAKGMKSLILDLRDNGGGYLRTAVDLADEFLDADKMIVYTQGNNSPKEEFKATRKGEFQQGNLIILINEGSASASEILSGSVQDWDRGLIIGRRSFGKGLVQRPYPLPDGSEIKITIARYYTPTGRLIQKSYEKGEKEYRSEVIKRYNNGELTNEDSVHFPKSQKYYTLQNKRTVYGGGGIMPDVFIPLDTTKNSNFYREILAKGVVNKFCVNYIDKNRQTLQAKYIDIEKFKNNFDVDEAMFKELLQMASKEKIEKNEKDINKSKEDIKIFIKAIIARDLWDFNEYFMISNETDETITKALEIITNNNIYNKKLLEKRK